MADFFSLVHPKVVHFPIALWASALGFEIASLLFKREGWHQTALSLYVLAVLFTPLVIVTGLWEAERLHLNHPLLDRHKMFGFWASGVGIGSLAVLWIFRKSRGFRLLFGLFLLVCVLLVMLAGHYGGQMVYRYGVGVES